MFCIRLFAPVILTIASALSLGFQNWCHVVKFPKSVGVTEGMDLPKPISIGFWGHSKYFFQAGGINTWTNQTLPTEWKVHGCNAFSEDIGSLDATFQAARVFSILTPVFAILSTVLVCAVRKLARGKARKFLSIPIALAALFSGLTLLITTSEICDSSAWDAIEQDQKCELDFGGIIAIINIFLLSLGAILIFISAGTNDTKIQEEVGSGYEVGEVEDESQIDLDC